jgi:outer membrane protein assembly factor BamB
LLDGDLIYVGGGGPGQSFLAFDKMSGAALWKTGDELMTHATPHVTTVNKVKQVIFFAQSGLVSLDAKTGQELWRTKFPFSVSTAASPISEGNLVYCSAGYGVGAGLFKVGDGPTAEEVWFKSNELMNHWSTPIVHDGHLYGIFEFKKYGKAPLQCVDLDTGEIKWAERGFGPGNCILVNDKLVVLSDAGELVIAAAKPDAYKEFGRAKILSGKCWSTPAYSNGRIYVRSTEEAACVQISR